MATRCTIKIEGIDYAKVYIHYDGYPNDKLPFLESFNKDFTENRGVDNDYKFAQLLRHTALKSDKFKLDNSLYTGYGIVPYDSDCGVEYEYTLLENGEVTYVEFY